MKNSMKVFPILIFILAAIGCQKAPQQNIAPAQKITVSFTYQPQSTLVHIAVAKGYFVEEGLDVKPVMRTFGKAALQTVLDGASDLATVAETPVMLSVLKGDKIFVIANIDATNKNNAIIARKDVGISVPGDLKGKRIGFTPGTTSDFFLDAFLTTNGIDRKEVQLVNLKPEEMQDAIMAKKIDAASTWNYPLTQTSKALGSDGITFYDKEIYTETFNIAAKQDFVKKNPETIKKFLRALLKAEKFVSQNPDEAQSIISTRTNVDKALIHDIWDKFEYHLALDQMLLITLEDEARWAMKNQLVKQAAMPNFKDFIYFDGLKAVNPDAIQMSR